jgi:CheY-like chemotaxis protein
MSVLIVEDNPISAKVLQHTLDRRGYETVTARDGKQALECLESRADIELVITDILMPRVDGAQFIRKLRDTREWTDIPVLVCTSLKPSFVNKIVPAHNWKYMLKPIRAETLIPKVQEALARRKPDIRNPDETMSQIGMEPEAFFAVIDQFLKIVRETIGSLEESLKVPSSKTVDLQVLSESATLLKAERVVSILEQLSQYRGDTESASVRSKYGDLLCELKSIQHYLTNYYSG